MGTAPQDPDEKIPLCLEFLNHKKLYYMTYLYQIESGRRGGVKISV